MPPKKDAKKEVVVKEDNSGIPKNDVVFRFEFEIKQSAPPPNIVLLWEWFSPNSAVLETHDASFIENWAPKNAAEDPNRLVFVKELDPIRIDDDFCKMITKKDFFLYLVNAEDSKIKHEVLLDYSQLLTNTDEKPTFSYSNNKLLVLEIEDLKLTLTADKVLLQPLYKHFLNPLEIEIVGAKDVPIAVDKSYEPCYVQYSFFDGTLTKTPAKLQKNTIKWGAKHVYLCGLLDQVELTEKIASHFLKMEVHDKDEVLDNKIKEELPLISVEAKIKEIEEKNKPPEPEIVDPKKKGAAAKKDAPPAKKEAPPKKDAKKDAKKKGDVAIVPIKDVPEGPPVEYQRNNYGVACFFLTDLLKPNVRTVKLRAPIVPLKKYQDLESNNLELNTTAKKKIPGIVANSNFFDCNSFLVITLNLAFPFGTFKMPEKLPEQVLAEEPVGAKKGGKAGPAPPTAAAAKKPAAAVAEVKVEKPEIKVDDPAIYERAVYLMPYKSPELVQKLQDAFYAINLAAAKIETGGLRAITTKKLSEEERKNRDFDFLGGFEILDGEFRLFVIEGLAGKAMKRLEDALPRNEPNTEKVKILKNQEVLFQERLYLDFDLDIKRIRLRESLSDILQKPDIYIRTKEPENICRTLNSIREISRCWNIKNVAMFDLFPIASDLVAMERKYSDSLSMEDIHGISVEVKKSKKSKKVGSLTELPKVTMSTTQMYQTEGNPSVQSLTGIRIGDKQQTSSQQGQGYSVQFDTRQTAENNNQSSKSLLNSVLKDKPKLLHSVKLKESKEVTEIRMRSTVPLRDGEEVYIYGSQRDNWYEKQMREQRERIRNDPHNFYTYSEQFLTLSVDPYNVNDEKKLSETLEKTKLSQKPAFRPVPPKSKEERDGHVKKPHISKIEEMQKFPYIDQREREEDTLKATRGEPMKNKRDFNSNIHPVTTFSDPAVLEEEKIKPVERERMEQEKKKKEQEEWENKLKGTKYLYTKKSMPDHPSQIDKQKNMLEGPAIKKGLMLKNSRIKESTLTMDRQLKDLPSSMYLKEGYVEKVDHFTRKVQPEKCVSPYDFDAYQNPEILLKTNVYRPLKLDPMYK